MQTSRVGYAPFPDDVGFQMKAQQIHNMLNERIHLSEQTLLDVGCGNGAYTIAMSSKVKTAIGIDIDKVRMRRTLEGRNGNTEFTIADAECLPICNAGCDIVMILEVLEHLEHPEKVLKEAHRVLKATGLLLVTVPNKLHPFDRHTVKIGRAIFPSYSIPFLSWLPSFIRKKLFTVSVRTYTRREIVRDIWYSNFAPLHLEYSIYPRLDRLSNKRLTGIANRIFPYLERNAFFKRFGMSILVLAEKREVV